jgi:glycosyltransferase involved in cell wall biosynthesis
VSFGVTAPATIQIALLKKKYDFEFVVVDSHLPSEMERGNSLAKKMFYYTFRALFSTLLNSTIDSCVALQEATASIISKAYGITLPIKVIPHGSDINEFYFDKPSRLTIRKQLGWLEKYFVIIYTGKVIEAKGVSVLFEAFNLLLKRGSSARLLIVGDGGDEYKKLCLSKLDSKFHHLVSWQGFIQQKNLYKYYSAADVAVWPLQESLAMNDAAACQLPFIANDAIGATLRISNDNALLYKKGDGKDLARKLSYLYNNPVIRKQMGKRGRVLIESKLSWQNLSKLFITTTNEK